MFQILEARFLAPDVKLFRIEAPRIARKRQAGQFVILRVHEHGERIPITIADSNAGAGRHHDRRPGHRQDHEAPELPGRRRRDPGRGRPPRQALGDRALRHRLRHRRRRRRGDRLPHRRGAQAGRQPRDLDPRRPHAGAGRPRGRDPARRATSSTSPPTTAATARRASSPTSSKALIDAGERIDYVLAIGPDPDDARGGRDDAPPRHQDGRQPQLDHGRRHRHVRRLPRERRRQEPVRLRGRAGVRRPPGRLPEPREPQRDVPRGGGASAPRTSSTDPERDLALVPGHECRLLASRAARSPGARGPRHDEPSRPTRSASRSPGRRCRSRSPPRAGRTSRR